MSPETTIDAYSPVQMARRVEKAGVTKGNMDFLSMFVLSILAGIFIAFGAALYTLVTHDTHLPLGMTKLIGGIVFCLGLILVIIAGAELFTGNTLVVMAYVSRKITLEQLMRNWVIVFVGNFVGSIAIALLVFESGHFAMGSWAVGAKALAIANGKVHLTFGQAFIRGVLCNMLVCLAVWLCFSGRSVTDKILAIIFPITAFVALGFEHCVANMYFIPVGLLLKSNPHVLAAAGNIDLSGLTASGFLVRNLLPVTLGNMVGGVFLVAGIYWFIYMRQSAAEPIRRLMTDGPATLAPSTTVSEGVKLMKGSCCSSLLVGEKGNAVGVVSEADVVRKVMAEGLDPAKVTLEKIMSSPLITAEVTMPIYEIYKIMSDRSIRHIVITNKGKQVGFVSARDMLRNPAL